MMEVLSRFPAIASIAAYQELGEGERALYDHFTLAKLEAEAKATAVKQVKETFS